MKTKAFVVAVCLLFIAISLTSASPTPAPSRIERGKYLVEQIGMCGECHTPLSEKGESVKEKHLRGSLLFFKPTVPVPNWADKAPNIAGLPGWEEEDAIKFFTTGLAYNDLPARPPMPQFRYSQADAAAIVAYLRSLAPEKNPRK